MAFVLAILYDDLLPCRLWKNLSRLTLCTYVHFFVRRDEMNSVECFFLFLIYLFQTCLRYIFVHRFNFFSTYIYQCKTYVIKLSVIQIPNIGKVASGKIFH